MDFIHDRSSNIVFSLHDSKIKKIIFDDDILTLKIDKLFQYSEDGEKIFSGDVVFYDCDLDECNVWIYDKVVYEGEFSGKAMELKEYIDTCSSMEFEIITEGYFGYNTTYTGWLWEEGKEPVSATMYIWNTGDMVYRIDE